MWRTSTGTETPREELARVTAKGHIELAGLADAPDTPEHMRETLRAMANDLADLGAASARADIARAAKEEELGLGQD